MNKLILLFLSASFILFSCNNKSATVPPAIKDSATNTAKDTIVSAVQDSASPHSIADTVTAAQLIVPGSSIGLTHIKQKSSELEKYLGKPDKEDAAMGKAMATWIAKNATHYETDIFSATNMGAANEASRVNQLRVTSPYFLTKEKIGVGSTLDNIKKAYPEMQKTGYYTVTKTGAVNYIYDAIDKGIAFEINSVNKCIGVAVHPPKDKAFETYLGFFENYVAL